MFDADKTRMIGLPYGETNYDSVLNRFHLILQRDGQTDGQTELLYQYHVLTRDKNHVQLTAVTETWPKPRWPKYRKRLQLAS